MFNMIEELFAPGRKHTDEERKRLELTRVDLNDGDPGRGPIDLASGKVVVRLPTQPEAEAAAEPDPTPTPTSTPDRTPAREQAPATAPAPAQASVPDQAPGPGKVPE
ncbi:DUF6191 domain-containing protein [Streptomyces sp. ActVer]|uniref:DUF6191 domain-containing protein n=1 Tax=Streptomyces sp. ActVer TaxID=3014558 RepID=UPI0022B3BC45|nr:DUF6191 domain-containing protein [Streptomyces sp. ActVer]MCZ4513223.1 DUF6191 domain-containing protein [Streptomyces sp. ActVer]